MSADNKRKTDPVDETEQRLAKRKDASAGTSDSVGAVDGIAGVGGSSGTGGVRAKARAVGDISGIPAVDEDEIPAPGSLGKGKGGSRTRQMSDGGLRGQTRGAASETVPNQEGADQKDAEKTNRSSR